jgi:hypothetical protein
MKIHLTLLFIFFTAAALFADQKESSRKWDSGFRNFMPAAEEKYANEFAEIEYLQTNDPDKAREQLNALQKKIRQQEIQDNNLLKNAIKTYKKEPDEIKLSRIRKMIEEKVLSAKANAKKRLKTASAKLAEVRKINPALGENTEPYASEIAECKAFLEITTESLVNEAVSTFRQDPVIPRFKNKSGKNKKASRQKCLRKIYVAGKSCAARSSCSAKRCTSRILVRKRSCCSRTSTVCTQSKSPAKKTSVRSCK